VFGFVFLTLVSLLVPFSHFVLFVQYRRAAAALASTKQVIGISIRIQFVWEQFACDELTVSRPYKK
jgi:hypothetical protein